MAPNARASAHCFDTLAHAAPMPTLAEIIQKLPTAPSSGTHQLATSVTPLPNASGVSQTVPEERPPWDETPTQETQATQAGGTAQAVITALQEDVQKEPLEEAAPKLTSLADIAQLFEGDDTGRTYAQLIRPISPRLKAEIFIEDNAPADLAAKWRNISQPIWRNRFKPSVGADNSGQTC